MFFEVFCVAVGGVALLLAVLTARRLDTGSGSDYHIVGLWLVIFFVAWNLIHTSYVMTYPDEYKEHLVQKEAQKIYDAKVAELARMKQMEKDAEVDAIASQLRKKTK